MNGKRRPVLLAAIVILIGAAWPATLAPPSGANIDQEKQRAVIERLDRMPLLFVPEQASPDGVAGFVVRGREASVWLSDTGLAYRLQKTGDGEAEETAGAWVVALDLVGATPRQPIGEEPLPTKASYFKGPKEQLRTGLPSYGSVRYHEPWPGRDVLVSGTAGELESTFVVRSGADPGLIRLAYRGAEAVRLEPDGSMVVDTPLGEIRELAPFAYQEIDGRRVKVMAALEFEGGPEPGRQIYRFRLGEYDPGHELVIDPVTIVYCGYVGGSGGDSATDIAVDAVGNASIIGASTSTDATFPVTVGPDLTYNGGDVRGDAFVAKVNLDGTGLLYFGFVGGSEDDSGSGIDVDSDGNACLTGWTYSTEATFPVAVGPDLICNGCGVDAPPDTFLAKVNPTGSGLDYCGYIGGTDGDGGYGIAVDQSGHAYVTGYTRSSEATFPAAGGTALALTGDIDAFVARVTGSGTGLDYRGYIGGLEGGMGESGSAIAVDATDSAIIAWETRSDESTFPVTVGPDLTYNGDSDAFAAKLISPDLLLQDGFGSGDTSACSATVP